MRSIGMMVLVAAVAVLCTPDLGYCGLYAFDNTPEYYGVELRAYVDGSEAGSWNINDVGDMAATAQSVWDVDPVQMTTTFHGLQTHLADPIEFSNVISKQFGFGDALDVPFTLIFSDYSAAINVDRGPFPIDSDLVFSMDSDPLEPDDVSILIQGRVEVEDDVFTYELAVHPDWIHNSNMYGEFDDSGYPDTLALRLDLTRRFNWGGSTYYRLFETTIDGHLVELYVSQDIMETNNWHGELIPEPATIMIFGLGGLLLRRRSR